MLFVAAAATLLLQALLVGTTQAQPVDSFWQGVHKIFRLRQTTSGGSSTYDDASSSSPSSAGLQIIGAGLPRTGTGSLHRALSLLGYKTYHMLTLFDEEEHRKRWVALARGTATLNDTLHFIVQQEGYNATLDHPAADHFETFAMQLYPDAQVILTVRDNALQWARSYRVLNRFVRGVLERPFSVWYPNPLPLLIPQKLRDLQDVRCALGTTTMGLAPCELVYGHRDRDDHEDIILEKFARHYERHNARVRQLVPADRLLEFNVKQGWGPLCSFLDGGTCTNDVVGRPFPHMGRAALRRQVTLFLQVVTYLWIPTLLLLVSLTGWCICGVGRRRRNRTNDDMLKKPKQS